MKVGVVGGGMLGLTLALRLGRSGHRVDLLEAEPQLGGLATWQDYGPFVWDRFYHCILPQDTSLLSLLDDLGLAGELQWTRTGTGYYAEGQFHPMSNNRDFLRFPVLSLFDKARLAGAVVWATKFADPDALYGVSAEEWLTRLCGERAYARFWQPLLKAKFGPFHDKVAAVFIYATLVRLFGARSAAAGKESLGYVRGGYQRIFARFRDVLESGGARIRTGTAVLLAEPDGRGCRVRSRGPEGETREESYDQVFFTAPTRLARKVVAPSFLDHVNEVERDHPTATTYLGVACLVLVLDRPLTPFYVLNIGEPSIELTGLIEMTNLIDPATQTGGRALVYLPRYMDSESPEFQQSDESLRDAMVERGLKRLFPEFDLGRAQYAGVHRARYVQPLPLVRTGPFTKRASSPISRPFHILNTSMLQCATLNNNEVVALVDRILEGCGSEDWRPLKN
jgi:protoporphyrinogen oxidase